MIGALLGGPFAPTASGSTAESSFSAGQRTSSELEVCTFDVGQGNAALITSPSGMTLLIDGGDVGSGTGVIVPHLNAAGVTSLDYIIATHYHADHIGGLDEVITSVGVDHAIYDRGGSYNSTQFSQYVSAAGALRQTITDGFQIDLGDGVTATCIAVNGNGVAVTNENDRSVCTLVRYGSFEYFNGAGISGYDAYDYTDVESSVAPEVGDIDVLLVNHQASGSSSNPTFVSTLEPEVGLISVGTNGYGHPTQPVIDRFVDADCYLYLTEAGSGGSVQPGEGEVVDGTIILSTDGENSYTVDGDTYPVDQSSPPVICELETRVGATTASIMWETDRPATSTVAYGLSTPPGQIENGSALVSYHTIFLHGLQPSTQYSFSVASAIAGLETVDDNGTQYYSFTTVSPFAHPLISEILYDPSGTEPDEELIELYNPTDRSFELDGWHLENSYQNWSFPPYATIAPSSKLSVASNATTFSDIYGFAPDIGGARFQLLNGGDILRLLNGSAEADLVAWEGRIEGWDVYGYSITRVPVGSDTDTVSDWTYNAVPDPENHTGVDHPPWCAITSPADGSVFENPQTLTVNVAAAE